MAEIGDPSTSHMSYQSHPKLQEQDIDLGYSNFSIKLPLFPLYSSRIPSPPTDSMFHGFTAPRSFKPVTQSLSEGWRSLIAQACPLVWHCLNILINHFLLRLRRPPCQNTIINYDPSEQYHLSFATATLAAVTSGVRGESRPQ